MSNVSSIWNLLPCPIQTLISIYTDTLNVNTQFDIGLNISMTTRYGGATNHYLYIQLSHDFWYVSVIEKVWTYTIFVQIARIIVNIIKNQILSKFNNIQDSLFIFLLFIYYVLELPFYIYNKIENFSLNL